MIEKKLGEVCDFQNGFAFKSSKFTIDGLPILRISNIQENEISTKNLVFFNDEDYDVNFDRYKIVKNDILIAMSGGTTGKLGVNTTDTIYYLNQRVGKFSPKQVLNRQYLYYFLQTKSEESLKIAGGAAQPNLSTEQIKNFLIPLPTLPEQKKIVEKLDTAFALIETAKTNIEKNIQNAKELFQSKLNEVFSQKGDGCEDLEIGELCVLKRGHNPPKSNFIYEEKEGYIRFYQIRDGSSDKFKVYVPDTPQLQRVEPDDILVVAYRHVGRAFRGVSGCFNVALCKITNRDTSILDNDYLFYLIPTSFVRGELLKQSERSLIPSMSVEHLKIIKIPVPPLKDQQKIVGQLDQLSSQTELLQEKYNQKLANLEELKKSILEKAFKGELV